MSVRSVAAKAAAARISMDPTFPWPPAEEMLRELRRSARRTLRSGINLTASGSGGIVIVPEYDEGILVEWAVYVSAGHIKP